MINGFLNLLCHELVLSTTHLHDPWREISLRIRRNLKESKQGWTTKQVSDMIYRESGKTYHYVHVYKILHKWGFKLKVPRKVHVNTASKEDKDDFKKEPRKYWML